MTDFDYIEAVNAFEDTINFPEVLPEYRLNDGWDGACGAEVRGGHYEPYPHNWDYNLNWCRCRYAIYIKAYDELDMSRPADKLPGWVYRRAIGLGNTGYG